MTKKQQARRIELVRLGDLKGNAANPKDHDIGEISASMDRFGYVEAVTIDERTGKLVAGHGRVETLLALKKAMKPPPAWGRRG